MTNNAVRSFKKGYLRIVTVGIQSFLTLVSATCLILSNVYLIISLQTPIRYCGFNTNLMLALLSLLNIMSIIIYLCMVFTALFKVRDNSGRWRFWGANKQTLLATSDENDQRPISRTNSNVSQITEVISLSSHTVTTLHNSSNIAVHTQFFHSLFCSLFCCCCFPNLLFKNNNDTIKQAQRKINRRSDPATLVTFNRDSLTVPLQDDDDDDDAFDEEVLDEQDNVPILTKIDSPTTTSYRPPLELDHDNMNFIYLRGFSSVFESKVSQDVKSNNEEITPYYRYNNIFEELPETLPEEKSEGLNICRFLCRILLLLFVITISCIICLCALASFYVNYLSQARWEGQWLHSDLLVGPNIQIAREVETGFAHIVAYDDADVLFGQGFLHAQDRFAQMELYRRMAKGTLSEVIGPSTLSSDILSRSLNISFVSEQVYANLDNETRIELQRYADGVNHFLRTAHVIINDGKLSLRGIVIELELLLLGYWGRSNVPIWTPQDTVACTIMLSLQLSYFDNINLEAKRFQLLISEAKSPQWIDSLYVSANNFTVVNKKDIPSNLIDLTRPSREVMEMEAERLYLLDLQKRLPKIGKWSATVDPHTSSLLGSLRTIALNSIFSLATLTSFNVQSIQDIRASSLYVVNHNLTFDKYPLLSTDISISNSFAPNIFYHVRLVNNGSLSQKGWQSRGASIPGIPFILMGTNGYVSWGINPSSADANDIFIVEGAVTTKHMIRVRDHADAIISVGNVKDVGPVIDSPLGYEGEKSLVLRTELLSANNPMLSALSLWSRSSQNITIFRNTLTLMRNFAPINIMFADSEQIAYQLTGTIPIRKTNHTGRYPVELNCFNGWEGFVPYYDMPSVINPIDGYIIAAHNAIVPDTYKYRIGNDWSPSYRAAYIASQLPIIGALSTLKSNILRNDFKTPLWALFNGLFYRLDEEMGTWPDLASLLLWNSDTSQDIASIFELWLNSMAAEMAPSFPKWFVAGRLVNDSTNIANDNDAKRVIENIRTNRTTDQWKMSHGVIDMRQTIVNRFEKAVSCICDRKIQVLGDEFTIRATPANGKMFQSAIYAQIISMNIQSEDNMAISMPMGQSAYMFSRYLDNMVDYWRQGDFVFISYDKIKGNKVVLYI